MKICSICKKEKELINFTVNKISVSTGKKFYKSFCKNCSSIYKTLPKGIGDNGKFKKGLTPWNTKDAHQSLKHEAWRKAILGRDNYACQHCSSTEYLNVHHIKNWNEYIELRFDIDNGITLCVKCHSKIHLNLLKNGTTWHKGRKMSLEHRKKLSDAHKGKHSPGTGFKKGHITWNTGLIGAQVSGMKGKNHSLESKIKMRDSHFGKKLTEEHKKNIGKALLGHKGWSAGKPAWNKGLKLKKIKTEE